MNHSSRPLPANVVQALEQRKAMQATKLLVGAGWTVADAMKVVASYLAQETQPVRARASAKRPAETAVQALQRAVQPRPLNKLAPGEVPRSRAGTLLAAISLAAAVGYWLWRG